MTRLTPTEEKIERHRLFWEGSATGRPLMGALVRPDFFPPMIHASPDESIYPESLDLPGFLEYYEERFADERGMAGDLVYVATPASGDPWGLPWMEAILGDRIRRAGSHAWAESSLDNWSLLDGFGGLGSNSWFNKLLEFTRELVKLSAGRFPVGTCLMRGPSDLAQALRGATQFGFDIADCPGQVSRVLQILASTWVRVANAQLDLIPPFRGGYCSGLLPLWAPGRILVVQEDASFFFSPALYRKLLRPADELIVRSFDYVLFHIHSGYTHILDDLLALPWRGAVDLSRDPTGPPLEQLFPLITRITSSGKRAVFHGQFTADEIDRTLNSLEPEGLCLMVVVDSVEQANELLLPFVV